MSDSDRPWTERPTQPGLAGDLRSLEVKAARLDEQSKENRRRLDQVDERIADISERVHYVNNEMSGLRSEFITRSNNQDAALQRIEKKLDTVPRSDRFRKEDSIARWKFWTAMVGGAVAISLALLEHFWRIDAEQRRTSVPAIESSRHP